MTTNTQPLYWIIPGTMLTHSQRRQIKDQIAHWTPEWLDSCSWYFRTSDNTFMGIYQ